MRNYLFLGCCLSALAVPAAAQEEPIVMDFSDVQIDPTTITVTATGAPIEVEDTGQSVTVIGREEIEAVQGADLTRVLRRAPGVTFSRNGGTGAFTGLRVRGAEAEQLLVLVDRVRVNDPASPGGGFDFGNLLSLNIDTIDLLRGANSTIWGADALGGVLAVTTRRESGLSASAEYGSDDTVIASAAGGLGDDDAYVGLAGSYYSSDGFSAAANGTEPDGFEQWALSAKGNVRLSYELEAFANARYAKGDLDIDGFPAPNYVLADTAETQETRQYSAAAGLAYDSGAIYVTARYSFADTERENFDPAFGSDPTFASDGHSDRVDLRGEWRPLGPLIVNFGGEYEWLAYETATDARETTAIAGVYAQAGIEYGALAAHIGARHDDHRRFGGETSFGADISYEIAPDWRLRASVGEGFKAPTLFQLFSDYGNEALQPERATSYDLGIAYGGRSDPVYAALTLYRRDSRNLISYVSCFGVTDAICTDRPFGTYDNTARATAQGFEVELGVSPSENWRFGAAYSYLDAENRTRGDANEGNWLARRPRHAITVSADWTSPLAGLTLGGDVRMVGDSFDDAGNFTRLDGYALGDVRASLPVGETFELFGRVENVTDADYRTVAGYATQGRAAYIGARISM